MAERIFISYRRDDAAGDAGRLADHLYARFGKDRVFLDIDTIDPGTDFVRVLHASLRETAVVLVVIGPRWLTLTDETGARRIDDPRDFVRIEVAAALDRDVLVVPVLVQGARMPRAADLPEALAGLVTRQAIALDHSEFHQDAERLCDRLARIVGGKEPHWRTAIRRWWPAAAAALLVGALTAYLASRQPESSVIDRSSSAAQTEPTAAEANRIVPEPSSSAPPPDAGPVATTRPAESRPASGGPAVPRQETGASPPLVSAQPAGGPDVGRGAETPAVLDAARRQADALAAEAALQRRRGQYIESLATLTRARALAPNSESLRDAQESTAMEWIRDVRVESGKGTFTEAIKPAIAVVDAALPSATGSRRADLLAHSGWATFLMWRDGNRQLDPAEWYREAISLDSSNPYANAMLAHWILFQGDDVSQAARLFAAANGSGRARQAVRELQWAAYGNTSSNAAVIESVRLADAMRRGGERLTLDEASRLWSPYYFLQSSSRAREREELLQALPPDDHISTLAWAFDEYAASDNNRQQTRRYWVALLHARAGRMDRAVADLRELSTELAKSSGSLRDAVQTALKQLQGRP